MPFTMVSMPKEDGVNGVLQKQYLKVQFQEYWQSDEFFTALSPAGTASTLTLTQSAMDFILADNPGYDFLMLKNMKDYLEILFDLSMA